MEDQPEDAAAAPGKAARRPRLRFLNSIVFHILGWSLVALLVPIGIWLLLSDALTARVEQSQAENLLCAQIQDVRASIVSQLGSKSAALDVGAVNRVLAQPTNSVGVNALWALNVGPLVGPKRFAGMGPPDGPVMKRLQAVPDKPQGTRYIDQFVDHGRRFVACSEIYDLTLPGFERYRKGIYVIAWPSEQLARLSSGLRGSTSQLGRYSRITLIYLGIAGLTMAAVLVTFIYGLLRELKRDFDAVLKGRADRLMTDRYPIELERAVTLFNDIIQDNERALKNTRRLVANVAHDLNNKLQVFSTAVNAPELDRTVLQAHIAQIKSQVERYRQLAISSRAESQVRWQRFDLVSFGQELLQLQAFDATNTQVLYRLIVEGQVLLRIVGKTQEIDPGHDGAWPRIMVRAHPGDLEIMLNNLLSNASKYGGGQVDLSLGVSGVFAMMDVDDDGLGIAEADRERVFEAGTMLNPDQRLPGTGYGLDIVKRMAQDSQGDVVVMPAPIGGARFRLTLPILAGEDGKH